MNDIAKAIDGKAIVTISASRMNAFLKITAPVGEGKPCSLEKAMEALANCQVVFGIDEAAVNTALEEHNWGKALPVAFGKDAVSGEDAKIVFRFDIRNGKPQIDEEGNVNYKELNLISNIRSGELLAEKTAPTEGRSGVDVTGQKVLPFRGKDINMGGGKNTTLDPTGCYLFARTDGHVTVLNNRVQVNPVFEVKGDVDYSSGDINFFGTVRISGSIRPGFKVQAEGDVEIGGSVEGAVVVSAGNILVKGGITSKSLVKAEGDILARFVENALMEAGISVLIKEAIIQSRVKAGCTVRVTDKKAIIVGGITQAGHEVESKTLGSQLATKTLIEVGVNPHYRDEYRQIAKELDQKKKSLDNIRHSLKVFQRYRQSPQEIDSKKKQALVKLLDQHKILGKEVDIAEKRLQFLENEFDRYQAAQVKARETAYPGVRICIGKLIYTVNDPVKYSAFHVDRGEIRVGPL